MFATATRNFVEEVDERGGSLIPMRSLNDCVSLLTVVLSQKRFWFWQKPKRKLTDFTLNDILTGDEPITPVLIETDFIKYVGTYGDNIQGTADGAFLHSNVSAEGKESSKLQLLFGSLKKDEVDVRKLLQDSKNRVLDMSHPLIQQTKKKRQALGVVKERIATSQPCSVIEELQQAEQCAWTLSLCGAKSPKVSLKDNGSLSKDSNVTMEIPTNTTLAYALIDLEVKHDGRYELCLMSDKGGFEVDSPAQNDPDVGHLARELQNLGAHFQLLSAIPARSRSSLLRNTAAVTEDRAALGALQSLLDQMLLDKSANTDDVSEAHKRLIRPVLDVLEESESGSAAQGERSASVLCALHLVISALDELSCESLAALRACSSPDALKVLDLLVQGLSGSGASPASGADLSAVPEDVLLKAERLFASCGVSLERDAAAVRINRLRQPGNRPLVLCIALRGLHSLAHRV
ncbi:gasdermin Eb [Syngnathoides biaculeatus]|uniref:gasdermin Eb n=1 Tax=Syngnathoides biaculeatus TaxID=300417 RepID=UPI002ADE309B|nr:gasdermin Eb [Syngnathoides biaculeatus]